MAMVVPKSRGWSRARETAPSGAGAEARTRVDSTTVARTVLAACLVGAGAVHFGVAPDHFGESRAHGAFFFLAGWMQVGLAIAVLLRQSRAWLRAVIVLDGAVLALWATSRLVGLPFGDDPWVPEAIAVPDVLANGLGLLAAVCAVGLLLGWWSTSTVPRMPAVTGGLLLGAALVALTTASVAPAVTGGHSHGVGRGTTEGAAGATHDHGADPTGTGTSVAVPAGIEAASGASPCEQSGSAGEGDTGAGGHGHHGPAPQEAITDPATRELLARQLSAARAAAMLYPTAADAMAAGYRKVTSYIPCIAAHYMRFSSVDAVFDPSVPEMLLYDGNGPDARIVGLSYYVSGPTSAPEGFAGPNDPWHQHIGLCVRNGLVVGGTQLSDAECATRGGVKANGSTSWMVHAWVVPGWESAWGTFSAEHPELGTSVAH